MTTEAARLDPRRDAAFGRFFARRGLRAITRSIVPPCDADRLSSWAAKYFRLPAHERCAARPQRSKS